MPASSGIVKIYCTDVIADQGFLHLDIFPQGILNAIINRPDFSLGIQTVPNVSPNETTDNYYG